MKWNTNIKSSLNNKKFYFKLSYKAAFVVGQTKFLDNQIKRKYSIIIMQPLRAYRKYLAVCSVSIAL